MQCYWFVFTILFTACLCEFIGDFIKLWNCQWPIKTYKSGESTAETLNVMILADTHLLGPIKGHWLDKLYREWHMRRAFQAAVFLHRPHVIFVLGDLFDEGDMVNNQQFKEFVRRFHSHFHTSSSIPVISAVGNHDVGFHYKMHPSFIKRFKNSFNNTGAQLYTLRGNHFVFINSMAMESDGCEFCENAKTELQNIAGKLNCFKNPKTCADTNSLENIQLYSRPIVLQHFPTYRASDKACRTHDAPHIEEYREHWEVLSKNATDWLGKLLNPRLSFAGHTHHYCYSINRWGIEEYTVASFSWRNKIDPSFLMVSLTPTSHAVLKCDMLQQQIVYNTYGFTFIVLILLFTWDFIKYFRGLIFNKNKIN